MDIIDIILQLPSKLADMAEVLQSWIFEGVTIGDTNVSFWALLGGALLTVLIVGSIIGAMRG